MELLKGIDVANAINEKLIKESADMAARSVACNGLQQKIDIVNGDIKEASEIFGAASFDVVTTNPPYMTDTHGLKNPDMQRQLPGMK